MVSLVTAVRDLRRLREIYIVLARHGFGEIASRLGARSKPRASGGTHVDADDALTDIPAEEAARGEDAKRRISLAERVRLVLIELGPSFVKLGQIASTRPDLLPADLIVELKKLQDNVPPVPFTELRDAVEAALGAPIPEIFESFDETPLAAASIAQVHRAVLKTEEGPRDVVVKVQRPGIANTIAGDLELLHGLAALIERAIPESKIYSPIGLVAQFDRAITSELDFTIEGDNARRFARNFEGSKICTFPAVYKEASAKTVLTLEFLPGKKINDALDDGYPGPLLAKRSVAIVFQQIFEDGFFHADPHPGNVLVLGDKSDPVIGLIDLGMVGRLSPELRDKTVDMMIAAVREDYDGLADAMYAIGTPTRKVDIRAFRGRVAELGAKYLGRPLKEIDLSAMIRDIVRGATEFGLEIPPDFLLVGKALMTIESIGKQMDPDLDVFGEAKPLFISILRRRYSPQRLGNEVWRGLEKLSGAAYELPVQLQEILDDVRFGRLSLKTVDPALPRVYDRLGRRIFTGLVVSSSIGSGAWLVAHDPLMPLGVVILLAGVLVLLAHVVFDLRRG